MSGVILKAWSTVGLLRSGVKTRSDVNAPLILPKLQVGVTVRSQYSGTVLTVYPMCKSIRTLMKLRRGA